MVDMNSVFTEALAKLSHEDQQRAWDDLICYGTSMVELKKDGTARLLDPREVMIATQKSTDIMAMPDAPPRKS